jgi:hypothetical protein
MGLLRLLRRPVSAVVLARALPHPGLGVLRVLRRLPILTVLIAAAPHRRPGAGDPIRTPEADQPAHGRQIDPPLAVGQRCRPSPAHRGAAAPKQREQLVKHVGGPAPELCSVVSRP